MACARSAFTSAVVVLSPCLTAARLTVSSTILIAAVTVAAHSRTSNAQRDRPRRSAITSIRCSSLIWQDTCQLLRKADSSGSVARSLTTRMSSALSSAACLSGPRFAANSSLIERCRGLRRRIAAKRSDDWANNGSTALSLDRKRRQSVRVATPVAAMSSPVVSATPFLRKNGERAAQDQVMCSRATLWLRAFDTRVVGTLPLDFAGDDSISTSPATLRTHRVHHRVLKGLRFVRTVLDSSVDRRRPPQRRRHWNPRLGHRDFWLAQPVERRGPRIRLPYGKASIGRQPGGEWLRPGGDWRLGLRQHCRGIRGDVDSSVAEETDSILRSIPEPDIPFVLS